MKKKLFIIGAIVIAAVSVWALAPKDKAADGEKPVIKIGLIYPLSGNAAMYGDTAKVVVKQFFDEFNKQPRKYRYETIFEDNQMNPAANVSAANKLIKSDGVNAIITWSSGFGMAVAPIAQDYNVLHGAIGTEPKMADFKHTILATNASEKKGVLLYEHLVKVGAKSVDVVVQNQSGTISWLDYFNEAVKSGGEIEIRNTYFLNDTERDFKIVLQKIKNDNPDYIVGFMINPLADIFMRQYRKEGVGIPLAGGEMFNFMSDIAPAEGLWQLDSTGLNKEYTERLLAATGQNSTNFGEWLAVLLQAMTDAYENAGTTEAGAIKEYIVDHFDGAHTAMAEVVVEKNGTIKSGFVIRRVNNGKMELVE